MISPPTTTNGSPRYEGKTFGGDNIRILFLSLCFLTVSFCGCGYSTQSLLPGSLKTIHIAPFKNKIHYSTDARRNLYIPLLELKVHNAVADRFVFDGHLRVKDSETADVILKGELIGYEREVLRYTENNDVQEYRIRIVVSLELWDTREQKTLWSEPSFAGETTYFVTGVEAKSEDTALQDALTDIARRIVERTIEDW